MAMTGGTSYLLKSEPYVDYPNRYLNLYLYCKEKEQDIQNLTTTLQLGMYVECGVGTGPWGDTYSSYLGTTTDTTNTTNCKTFNGAIPYVNLDSTYWIVENQEIVIQHSWIDGTAKPTIYWQWGISAYNSFISGYQKPSGSMQIVLTPIIPYTQIIAPSELKLQSKAAEAINNMQYEDVYNSVILINWDEAQAGRNNPLDDYIIEYRKGDTPDALSSTWTEIDTVIYETTQMDWSPGSDIAQGEYVQLRIKNIGSVVGYESDYTESNVIKRNSSPKPVSEINIINLPNNEYSYGEAIKIQWSVPEDVDNNVERYYLGIISNNSTLWQSLVIGTEYVFDTNNSAYSQIKNSEQFKFAIVPQDVFGLYPEDPTTRMTFSSIITRYDISGVRIGKNGKWIDCQVYVGINSEWVEQEINLGLNNSWNETSTERL